MDQSVRLALPPPPKQREKDKGARIRQTTRRHESGSERQRRKNIRRHWWGRSQTPNPTTNANTYTLGGDGDRTRISDEPPPPPPRTHASPMLLRPRHGWKGRRSRRRGDYRTQATGGGGDGRCGSGRMRSRKELSVVSCPLLTEFGHCRTDQLAQCHKSSPLSCLCAQRQTAALVTCRVQDTEHWRHECRTSYHPRPDTPDGGGD